MQRTPQSLWRVTTVCLLVFIFSGPVDAQRQSGVILQDAPLVLLPDRARTPLLIMERGVRVRINAREGDWYNVTVDGSYWGERTGYVEARLVQVVASPDDWGSVARTPRRE